MSVPIQFKKNMIRLLPKSVINFFRNQVSLVNIPYDKESVISDLFPFRIQGGWETHFELLNIPILIDPQNQANNIYNVKFMFFDENGNLFYEWIKQEKGCFRQTISINEILKDISNSGFGTFACFHENYLPRLQDQGGFLAERGYVGYSNQAISKMKGYVHGNLDALALNSNGTTLCMGKSFRFKNNEYRLQHLLEGPATYELGFVNSTISGEYLTVELLSSDNSTIKKEMRFIPSKGITWFSEKINTFESRRVIIHSKLNLPRPVIFRVEEKSFDVFHG
jgi:hypothetical protein